MDRDFHHSFMASLRSGSLSTSMDKISKLVDALIVLKADYKLVEFSNRTFLPAAKEYLQGKNTRHPSLRQSRIARARLGGASRWLYARQKETFVTLLHQMFPVKIPNQVVDSMWRRIVKSESKVLSRNRKKAAESN